MRPAGRPKLPNLIRLAHVSGGLAVGREFRVRSGGDGWPRSAIGPRAEPRLASSRSQGSGSEGRGEGERRRGGEESGVRLARAGASDALTSRGASSLCRAYRLAYLVGESLERKSKDTRALTARGLRLANCPGDSGTACRRDASPPPPPSPRPIVRET
jgi:hypothetical protein